MCDFRQRAVRILQINNPIVWLEFCYMTFMFKKLTFRETGLIFKIMIDIILVKEDIIDIKTNSFYRKSH